MTRDEIKREEWQDFLDQFTRQHRGWLVTVERGSAELFRPGHFAASGQTEILGSDLPLEEISVDRKGGMTTVVMRIGEGLRFRSERIENPSRLLFEQTPEGAHKGLRLDSEGGETTFIRFRSAAIPEMLDGIAESER